MIPSPATTTPMDMDTVHQAAKHCADVHKDVAPFSYCVDVPQYFRIFRGTLRGAIAEHRGITYVAFRGTDPLSIGYVLIADSQAFLTDFLVSSSRSRHRAEASAYIRSGDSRHPAEVACIGDGSPRFL